MASQGSEELHDVKLAPSRDGEPAAELPPSSSPDPNVDSREILEVPRAQALIQDPGPQDNAQAQAPNHRAASVGENNAVLGLTFPRKLWMILEDNAFTSVRWNHAGDTVIIVDKDLFEREVLQRQGAERIFETDSLKTFIRLMNLYGFSKIRATEPWGVQSPENQRMMVYRNANFQRDKPFLLRNIQLKSGRRVTTTWPGTGATPPTKKARAAATRHSPRIHHKASTKVDEKAPGEAPNAPGPSSSRSFTCSGPGAVSSTAGQAMGNGGPSGEGPSRNGTFAPPAAARRDGAGEVPDSLPVGLCYCEVLALNTILPAALLVMSPDEAPSENGEQEGPLCVRCEHVKEPPGP